MQSHTQTRINITFTSSSLMQTLVFLLSGELALDFCSSEGSFEGYCHSEARIMDWIVSRAVVLKSDPNQV